MSYYITNPYAWAVCQLKGDKLMVVLLCQTRDEARRTKCDDEVIRKVFIQPAEAVRRGR
jgi:hypothetical protein